MGLDWQTLEMLVRNDPGKRGLASFRRDGRLLAEGGLQRAAESLLGDGKRVVLATGFVIVGANPPAAETDGPPGALYLAEVLDALGIETVLLSDRFGLPLLRAGIKLRRLENVELAEFPLESDGDLVEQRVDEFFSAPRHRRLTHLVAIERVGPSHTLESLAAQRRVGPPPLGEFERDVSPGDRGRCHNMRGVVIDEHTAPIHRLFEAAARRGGVQTIGIADGGNEIGMGSVPWELLRQAVAGEMGGRIACRVSTDHLILAGISNWGAYALAAAVAVLEGQADLVNAHGADDERRLIELLAAEAGAVDGVTGLRQPTVDGVPLDDYLAVLEAIRRQALERA